MSDRRIDAAIERANLAVQDGKLWRAKEILSGNITNEKINSVL